MSTERKPGSRGAKEPQGRPPAGQEPRFGGETPPRDTSSGKGSTKTVSPKRAFKRKPRK